MSSLRSWLCLLFACGYQCLATDALLAAEPESNTFDAKGVKIHYLLEGKGEPVVLIHGLASSAAINWKLTGVIDDLARDHLVIAFDMPGHGQSEKPDNDAAYGLQVVEDVVLLLDHLRLKKAHIVGYSMGGMVAMKLLARHPERVRSALVGGMGWFREGSLVQLFWDKSGSREGGRKPAAFVRNVNKLALTEAELKKIALPVEILVGERDPCKQLYVLPLERIRTDWPVVEIADAGHFDCIVKKQFREVIGSWVRKNSR